VEQLEQDADGQARGADVWHEPVGERDVELNPTTTASKLLSATGSFQACNTHTGGGNCLPTMGGSF
jgi:hypothetical protein